MTDETNRQLLLKQRVNNPGETEALVNDFLPQVRSGVTVAFYGNLGSGKTFFVQTLCRLLATEEPPTSPTFTIINEYRAQGGMPVYHFDFYRIEHDGELLNLGLDDYFYGDGLCLIEWADKIAAHLPLPRFEVYLEFVERQPEARDIAIYAVL